ncbi:hypothetical protein ATANTOWER_030123 [Ataeniobius toweri]|uniref:Uncharacterized protein n=1 Tax=Ataeniobius toweri TaxID=208326 RepID=A0ABU7C5J0_9TELE|nr:hypothetical protein [Ataeniobius toweri]
MLIFNRCSRAGPDPGGNFSPISGGVTEEEEELVVIGFLCVMTAGAVFSTRKPIICAAWFLLHLNISNQENQKSLLIWIKTSWKKRCSI